MDGVAPVRWQHGIAIAPVPACIRSSGTRVPYPPITVRRRSPEDTENTAEEALDSRIKSHQAKLKTLRSQLTLEQAKPKAKKRSGKIKRLTTSMKDIETPLRYLLQGLGRAAAKRHDHVGQIHFFFVRGFRPDHPQKGAFHGSLPRPERGRIALISSTTS